MLPGPFGGPKDLIIFDGTRYQQTVVKTEKTPEAVLVERMAAILPQYEAFGVAIEEFRWTENQGVLTCRSSKL